MPSRHAPLIVCLALLIALPASAQRRGDATQRRPPPPVWRGKADVSGKVVDEGGKGVGDAKVTLMHAALHAGFFVMTKKNGEFEAKDIRAGQWSLVVEKAGFGMLKTTRQLSDGRNPPVELRLTVDPSNEILARADALFQAGRMAEARAEYLKVREIHPDLGAVNRAIAFTYGRERNHAEALKYLDLALEQMSGDPQLLQLAAASAIELNDAARAEAYLAKIDDGAMSEPDILLNPAVGLLRRQQTAPALRVLDRVIARFPQAPDPYFFRGLARLQAKNAADAKVDLEKYVSLAPADAPQLAQAKDLLAKIK